jgi:hypothetical protein
MNEATHITLRRVASGWYEGETPDGQRIELIDAAQHHGHPEPLWLLGINGQCDDAFPTKREALDVAKAITTSAH